MKIKDYEAYRGIYCSLCRTLGKNYGLPARFTLSYDVTMLAIVQIAAAGNNVNFKPGRCPFNPSKRCNYCNNQSDALDFAAAVSVLLTYHKLKDNLNDDSFFGKLLALLLIPLIYFSFRKAQKKYPDVASYIKEAINNQTAIEKQNSASVDEAAAPMAELLSKLFAHGFCGDVQKILERFGYCMGRWIYIIDAAQDIEKDISKKSYNVYVNSLGIEVQDTEKIKQARESAKQALNFCCAEAIRAYQLGDFKPLVAIIDNVLYDGLFHSMNNALDETQKKRKVNRKDEESL